MRDISLIYRGNRSINNQMQTYDLGHTVTLHRESLSYVDLRQSALGVVSYMNTQLIQSLFWVFVLFVSLYFQDDDGVWDSGDYIGWFVIFPLLIAAAIGIIILIFRVGQWYARRRNGGAYLSEDILLGEIAKLVAAKEQLQEQHRKEIEELQRKQQLQLAILDERIARLEKQAETSSRVRRRLSGEKPETVAGDASEEKPVMVSTQTPLLVASGSETNLEMDYESLRTVQARSGMRFTRIKNATLKLIDEKLTRARVNKRPFDKLHLSLHSTPEGIILGGELITSGEMSETFKGIKVLLIAGCSASKLGGRLGSVRHVITFSEDVPHEDAAVFAQAFWTEIGLGKEPPEAFETALDTAPAGMDEYVEYHG